MLEKPIARFRSRKNFVETRTGSKIKRSTSQKPLEDLESLFNSCKKSRRFHWSASGPPFQGGAVGYLSYEALHYLENVPLPDTDDVHAPWMDFSFFDSGVAFDHWEKKFHVFGPKEKTNGLKIRFQILLEELRHPAKVSGQTGKIASNFSKSAYVQAIGAIQERIASGETFQANLSQRFYAKTSKTPWNVFVRLNQINPSPYSAFFQSGDLALASASPELLFSIQDGTIVTRPIAGTRPRGKTAHGDRRLEKDLVDNAKENAEHAMLVDLERNDVGRICRPGSVVVQNGFLVEKYSHVQHLVSQVKGRLNPEKNAFDAIRALFPGGTITGCPKVRTMRILREVEPVARGPYSGSLGWIGWNGDAAFNILIRTIYFKREKTKNDGLKINKKASSPKSRDSASLWSAYFHAGGGIVYDSRPQKEYEESLQKAKAMKLALSP